MQVHNPCPVPKWQVALDTGGHTGAQLCVRGKRTASTPPPRIQPPSVSVGLHRFTFKQPKPRPLFPVAL